MLAISTRSARSSDYIPCSLWLPLLRLDAQHPPVTSPDDKDFMDAHLVVRVTSTGV